MSTTHEPYLKAAGSDRLAPFYDAHVPLLMRERFIKRRVIERARLQPGQRLLDVGCGTGTLVLMAQRMHPDATIVGVDGDPVILAIARRKAAKEGIPVQLDEAMAYAMPYADGSFDAVVSTLVLHHLTHDQQIRCLAEIKRVLVPGGRLVIADFAPPHNRLMKLARFPARLLFRAHTRSHGLGSGHGADGHHGHTGGDHGATVRQRRRFDLGLAALGWEQVARPRYFNTLAGSLALYSAVRPVGA